MWPQALRWVAPLTSAVHCQGVEMHVVPAARQLLVEKVHRLHIGTHHITIHQAIRQVLQEDNWWALASQACG